MRGSCLCGGCVFELKGRISAVGKCHCSMCRKTSGTGSNAVHWARPENVEWVAGAELIKQFERANRTIAFCRVCGSPLPNMDKERTKWFVPAGLLDGDPQVGIRGHIWVSSKPSWKVTGDSAPQLDEAGP
jgi:hypothetical protein